MVQPDDEEVAADEAQDEFSGGRSVVAPLSHALSLSN
jgi:hypothetical protein